MVKFDQRIPAGGKGRISLSVRIDPQWAGMKFSKRALVRTNDPNLPRFTLGLSGQVEGMPLPNPIDPPPDQPGAPNGKKN